IHFHDLILLAVTGAHHRQQCLGALLAPRGPGDPTPFDHLDHQWTLRTISSIEAPPGRLVKRLAPDLHAVPGALAAASLPGGRCGRLQTAYRRVRGDREQRGLAQGSQATPM